MAARHLQGGRVERRPRPHGHRRGSVRPGHQGEDLPGLGEQRGCVPGGVRAEEPAQPALIEEPQGGLGAGSRDGARRLGERRRGRALLLGCPR